MNPITKLLEWRRQSKAMRELDRVAAEEAAKLKLESEKKENEKKLGDAAKDRKKALTNMGFICESGLALSVDRTQGCFYAVTPLKKTVEVWVDYRGFIKEMKHIK